MSWWWLIVIPPVSVVVVLLGVVLYEMYGLTPRKRYERESKLGE